jgi:hypothetical protein
MNTHRLLLTCVMTVAALGTAALTGCSTLSSGMGGGDLVAKGKDSQPVMLTWQSHDGGITGTMAATLPDATFEGQFVQITQQTRNETMAPMWMGWNEGWSDWPYWPGPTMGMYDVTTFGRQYSGKVVANLRNPGGQYMRCRFDMNEPAAGMAGGGQGECQMTGGRRVDAVINRAG